MNKQAPPKAIEWTRVYNERDGYTWNPVAGCVHDCEWIINGERAVCYAKTVAERVAQKAYPQGFAAHYWHPERLNEPLKVKEPAGIFIDSMSDLMGIQVPDKQVEAVLDVCRKASHHIFFLLTKNAPRLLKFQFPSNVWVGVSSAPDFMFGKQLERKQQEAYMHKALSVLTTLNERGVTTWSSVEPLSWNIAPIVEQYPKALSWVVIGAASDGAREFPPLESDVRALLDVADKHGIRIFFKGNMKSLPMTLEHWREEFPIIKESLTIEPTPTQQPCAICATATTQLVDDKPICPACTERIEAYQARVRSRLERLQAAVEKVKADARRDLAHAEQMASIIPFGQPILRGHHSEKWDTNYRNRIDKTWRRGFEKLDKAKGIERRIQAAEAHEAISSDDPQAVLKLQAKIGAAEAEQAHMKATNAEIRKVLKLSEDQRVAVLAKNLNISEVTAKALLTPDDLRRVGYPDYKLTNNNANIRRMKERLAELQAKAQTAHTTPERETFGDVTLERSADDNRLRLRFPGKPAAAVIALLKHHGFIWSGLNGAWQRQLNHAAESAAKQVLTQLGKVNTPTIDTGTLYDQPQPAPRNPILCADCGHDFGTAEERRVNLNAETILVVHNGATPLCGTCFRKRNGLDKPEPVPQAGDCYATLGLMRALAAWKPVPDTAALGEAKEEE